MRKWHRWLSVFFGIFLFWIAATGVLSHLAGWSRPEASAVEAAPPAGFVCPPEWRCTPPRPGAEGLGGMVGFFHHLHSGEEFGKLGEAISFLSGLALLFFAFSGVWLYIRMWRERARRKVKDRWFWK
ncbi:PepSY-associated TM helix domain-containing protein [Qipengyuania sp.]|uniref:PepSY-associated TM helix domain-containing protein n=1 Tax=Qipengyuania sp. TaxID=2004515 RepID=UPI0035C816C4